MKRFEIIEPIPGENKEETGVCEVTDMIPDVVSHLIEYESDYGVFYTDIDRLKRYKMQGKIIEL